MPGSLSPKRLTSIPNAWQIEVSKRGCGTHLAARSAGLVASAVGDASLYTCPVLKAKLPSPAAKAAFVLDVEANELQRCMADWVATLKSAAKVSHHVNNLESVGARHATGWSA